MKQMEQNAEKRALRDEEKYQESLRQLERLKEMKREDRKVGAGNRGCREVSTWLERDWQCWVSHTRGVGQQPAGSELWSLGDVVAAPGEDPKPPCPE